MLPAWYGASLFPLLAPPLAIPIVLAQFVVGLILIFKGPVPYDADDRSRGHGVAGPVMDEDMDRAIAAMVAAQQAQQEGARAAPRSAVTRVGKAPATTIGLSPARRGGFGQRGVTA